MSVNKDWFLGRPNNYYSGKDRELECCMCNGGKITRVKTTTTNPPIQPTTNNKITQPNQAKSSSSREREWDRQR